MMKASDPKPSPQDRVIRLGDRISAMTERNSLVFSLLKKPMAIVLILILATTDFLTLMELFRSMDTPPHERIIYSTTFALCLEGIPTFMGICLSKIFDRTTYRINDRINAIVGFVVAAIGLCIAFDMVMDLRAGLIESRGGEEAFLNNSYAFSGDYDTTANSSYLKDSFLKYLPWVTSIFAGVTSWVVFPSNDHAQLERELDSLHIKYIEMRSEFIISRNRYEIARADLWKDLAGSDTSAPRTTNAFRKECHNRIRGLLIKDCMLRYPNQIDRYNAAVEEELKVILAKMADFSTLPDEIRNINIEDIISKYNSRVEEPINSWDYSVAESALEDQLKQLLSNAIVIAQYKSTSNAHYKEGNWW